MTSKQATFERLLTTKEAAELTGYSVAAFRKWRKTGSHDGPPFYKKPGRSGHVRYRQSQLEQWLKKQFKKPVSLTD